MEKGIILFVEDRIDDFEIAVDVLRVKGEARDIEREGTLKGAIARVKLGGVELVILDLSLPDVESASPLETLRLFEAECPGTKVLVYSGSSWIASEIERRQHQFVNKDNPQYLVRAVAEELRRTQQQQQNPNSSLIEYRLNALERASVDSRGEEADARIREELHKLKLEIAHSNLTFTSRVEQLTEDLQNLQKEWASAKPEFENITVLVPLGRAFYRLGLDKSERERYVSSLVYLTPFLVFAQKKPLAMAVFIIFGFLMATTAAMYLSTGKVEVFKWVIDFVRHAIKILS
jgi:DNA-binding NarL/FixJ family response regulator